MSEGSNTKPPLQVLQVFNSGRPCGWLGRTSNSFWFHYSSNNSQQHWVSLLMPPDINFYQQTDLFPVFAQHVPGDCKHAISEPLTYLQEHNGKFMGSLSFANPDNPVFRSPQQVSNLHLTGSMCDRYSGKWSMLINTRPRGLFADTLLHCNPDHTLFNNLRVIKRDVDPKNRLRALNWTLELHSAGQLTWYRRPDLDYNERLLGVEPAHGLLTAGRIALHDLTSDYRRYLLAMQELIRTYCKNSTLEFRLFSALYPLIKQGHIEPLLLYQPSGLQGGQNSPVISGMEYLLKPLNFTMATHDKHIAHDVPALD